MIMGIDEILKEITKKGSIYDEIINNIITPRFELKPELISEIALSFLENREKIEQVYKDKYFKYYFISTVKNQVHSNTSSFHKINRIKDYEYFGEYNHIIDEDDINIQSKIDFEDKFDKFQKIYKNTKKTWFENLLWEEYFINDKTYRAIEDEYGIDHVSVFHHVKNLKERIKKNL
jgi:hypothetical protein